MNRRQASMLVAAALSTLFGCGAQDTFLRRGSVLTSDTRKTKTGGWITKRVYSDQSESYQLQGENEVFVSEDNGYRQSQFNASESTIGKSRSAAAVEREKLVPTAPAQQSPAPGGITSPLTGPKIDLPTQQIYQPPGTPPGYQPPSGYHH